MSKEIKSTKNYKQFKKLFGNRGVADARVNKIIKSIQKVGYITSPIIVNENMEVIDGQGRLEALERLHMSVEYIVEPGIGIEECISMNVHNTNWTIIDYLKSYAERGNENYIRLARLMQEYPIFTIHCFAPATLSIGKFSSQQIMNGDLIISEENYQNAKEVLDYVIEIEPYLAGLHTRSDLLIRALMFIYRMPEVNRDRLKEKMITESTLLTPFRTLNQCIQSIENLYNYGTSKPVYMYTEYRKLMHENLKKASRKSKQRAKERKALESIEIGEQ